MDMNEFNEYLEEQALKWEQKRKEANIKTDWPEYFRGLKNLHEQKHFTISSATLINADSPITKFINENIDNYDVIGFTGCAEFIRKSK